MHNIEKWSLHYMLLKTASGFWHNRIYYRRVTAINYDKLPADEPLIFATVHQNALMDALAVLYTLKGQPVFLARSDIFRKSLVARILYFIKILPIFRIRDGISALKQNDATFNKTIDVLKNKNGLVILPEGFHEGKRRLKPLKKGIARIGFQAEEASDFSLGIKIVPVGLDYSNYFNFRSELFLNFGEPVELSDYFNLYRENPARGMNKLLEELSKRLRKQMIHIESKGQYEVIDLLREIYRTRMVKLMSFSTPRYPYRFFADQKLISILNQVQKEQPSKIEELSPKVRSMTEGVRSLRFRYWVLQKDLHSFPVLILKSLFMVFSFPVYIWGVIHNYLPYKIPVWLIRPIKDVMFHSSFKFVISFLVFQIYYLLLFIIILIFADPLWLKLAYIASVPVSGLFAFHYYLGVKKIIAAWRYNFMVLARNRKLETVKKMYDEIIGITDRIVKPFLTPEN
ncbi:MAG: 1-acyl-sn-glycerol-3-phosphate acyltransferase [Bacteroidales bacterium]|nr:MAG: 1-acyl-sn-glycerol-3-phosphate acyltransferase [Bacteroidales bacterium]